MKKFLLLLAVGLLCLSCYEQPNAQDGKQPLSDVQTREGTNRKTMIYMDLLNNYNLVQAEIDMVNWTVINKTVKPVQLCGPYSNPTISNNVSTGRVMLYSTCPFIPNQGYSWDTYIWNSPDQSPALLWTGGVNLCAASGTAVSPDGTKVAYGIESCGGKLALRKINEAQPFKILDNAYLPSWSPDGNLLAFSKRLPGFIDTITVYDVINDKQYEITNQTPGSYSAPRWSPIINGDFFNLSYKLTFYRTEYPAPQTVLSSIYTVDIYHGRILKRVKSTTSILGYRFILVDLGISSANLTRIKEQSTMPNWVSDTQIVYRDEPTRTFKVMNADGSNVMPLQNSADVFWPYVAYE